MLNWIQSWKCTDQDHYMDIVYFLAKTVNKNISCFGRYPQCLYLLDLLQYEHFRAELMNTQCAKFIEEQQLLHWQHYQRKRLQLLNAQAHESFEKQTTDETQVSASQTATST